MSKLYLIFFVLFLQFSTVLQCGYKEVMPNLSLSYLYHSGYTVTNQQEECVTVTYQLPWLHQRYESFAWYGASSYYDADFFTKSVYISYFLGNNRARRYAVSCGVEYVPSKQYLVRSGAMPSFSLSYRERFSHYVSFYMKAEGVVTSQEQFDRDVLMQFKLGVLVDFYKQKQSLKLYSLDYHHLMMGNRDIFKSKIKGSSDAFLIPLRLELPKIVHAKKRIPIRLLVSKTFTYSRIRAVGSRLSKPIVFSFLKEDDHYRIFTAYVELPTSYSHSVFTVDVLFLDSDGTQRDSITETSVFLK